VKQALNPDVTCNVNVERLNEFKGFIKADPLKFKLKYHVDCIAESDLKVRSEISRFELGKESIHHNKTFTFYADQPKQLLGSGAAPSPSEYMLMAIGSCLTMSFIKAAAIGQLKLGYVNCKVKAKVDLRAAFADDFPNIAPGFRAICAKFDIQGDNLDHSILVDLVKTAELSSVVTQTIKRGTPIRVCLKGEGKEFEREHGLIGKEGVKQAQFREGQQYTREFEQLERHQSPQQWMGESEQRERQMSPSQWKGETAQIERQQSPQTWAREPEQVERQKSPLERGMDTEVPIAHAKSPEIPISTEMRARSPEVLTSPTKLEVPTSFQKGDEFCAGTAAGGVEALKQRSAETTR